MQKLFQAAGILDEILNNYLGYSYFYNRFDADHFIQDVNRAVIKPWRELNGIKNVRSTSSL